MRRIFLLLSGLVLALNTVHAETKTMLVLDGSGSMWGQIDGEPKISIARDVVNDLLSDWNQQDQLGLTVYGHRRKGDCEDIEEVIAVGDVDLEIFGNVVNNINPKGKTPMSDAVRIAAESLRYTEEKASVILVSDGKETCHADPCALASELEKSGVDFTAHVIGFDVTDGQAVSQLQCIANNTGGTFSAASNATELKDALNNAVKESVSGANLQVNVYLSEGKQRVGVDWIEVLDTKTNQQVSRALGGSAAERSQAFTLKPGTYKVIARDSAVSAESSITIVEGERHEIDVVLNAGLVTVKTVAKPNGDPLAVDWIGLYQSGTKLQQNLGGTGVTTFLAPAGNLVVDGRKNPLSNSESIELVAGETISVELVLNSGTLVVSSILSGSNEKLGVSWFTAFRLDKDGNETSTLRKLGSSGTSTMQLPVGRYRIQASHGDGPIVSDFVEILAEQTTTTQLVFDHGWVDVSIVKGGEPIAQNWIQANVINEDSSTGDQLVRKLGGSGRAMLLIPSGVSRVIAIPRQQGFSNLAKDVKVDAGETVPVVINFPSSGTVNLVAKLRSSDANQRVDWFYAYRMDDNGMPKQTSKALGGSGKTNFLLPVGKYLIEAQFSAGIKASKEVTVLEDQSIEAELVFDYAWVNASFTKNSKQVGQNWIQAVEINADGSNGKLLSRALGGSGKASLLVPLGKVRILGQPYQRGVAAPFKDILVEAGQTVNLEIPVP